jgi:hypothetical protein
MFEVVETTRYAQDLYRRSPNADVIRLKYDGLGSVIEIEMPVSEAKELAKNLHEVAETFEPTESELDRLKEKLEEIAEVLTDDTSAKAIEINRIING